MGQDAEATLSVAQNYCDAWTHGDTAALLNLYADGIVLHYFGNNPLSGDHAGKAAALTVLGRMSRIVTRGTPQIHDVMASRDHAVILAREHWRDGEQTYELDRVLLYHVRDGKLAECWVYDADQRLVDTLLSKDPSPSEA